MPYAKDNPEGLARIAAFIRELQQLGWTDGRNVKIEYRWDTGDLRKAATELLTLSPDVILASATPAVAALQQATRTVPIVFTQVADPISAGFVASLAKPGGNITGFTNFDYTIGCEMARVTQGNCSQRDTCRGYSRPYCNRQYRAVGCNQFSGAVIWSGGEPTRWAGRQRY